jgi:hypothetical protein
MSNFFSNLTIKIIVIIFFIFLLFLIVVLYFYNQELKKQVSPPTIINNSEIDSLKSKIDEKNQVISELTDIASTTQKQYQDCINALPEFIEFSSKNKKLKFLYNKNWICREIVTDRRVDCYPMTRQKEEHDMGLDQPGVYFADLTMFFSSCEVESSQKINSAPKKVVKEDVGTFYHFYKNFNGCEIIVMAQNPEIDTEKKLYDIIH